MGVSAKRGGVGGDGDWGGCEVASSRDGVARRDERGVK